VKPVAAVALRKAHPGRAERGELGKDVWVVATGAVVGADARSKLAGAELADRRHYLLLVLTEGEIEHETKLLRRRRSRARRGRRDRRSRGLRCGACLRRWRRAGRWACCRQRLEVVWPNVADERQVVADAEDERRRARAVQLRLDEVAVDLLQLMDASNRIEMRGVALGRGRLERIEVGLGDHGCRDRVGENLGLE